MRYSSAAHTRFYYRFHVVWVTKYRYTPAPELTLRYWDLRLTSPHGHGRGGLYFECMSKQYKTVSLSDEQRIALEALCRRRKVDALV